MDKALQEVIAKLNQQRPQVSQPQAKQIEKPVENAEVLEDEDDFSDLEEEEKPVVKPVSQEQIDATKKAEIEMELLNNNGRFRAELLYQLQELNKALVVIAQVLQQNGQR